MSRAWQSHAWLAAPHSRPRCIAHRGASDYALDNSRESFERAIRLGADWLEVDVRTTGDGRLVVWHDPTTRQLDGEVQRIDALAWPELQALATAAGRRLLLFDEVVELALRHDVGLYVDAKDHSGAVGAADALAARGVEAAVIASYSVDTLQYLGQQGCTYPLSILVPPWGNPLALAARAGASIVHLCWSRGTRGKRRRDLDRALLEDIRSTGLAIVLWHQEDRAVIEQWLTLPVWGICSNKPELLKSYRHESPAWKPRIMCEGGLGFVAPPQTLTSASVAFNAGYDYVRVNTSVAGDGEVVTLATSPLADPVMTVCPTAEAADRFAIRDRLDPAAQPDLWQAGTRVARLDDMLALAKSHQRGLAIEVKPRSLQSVLSCVGQANAMDLSLFWSSQPQCLPVLRDQAPAARIVSQRRHYPSLEAAIGAADAQVVEFDIDVDDPDHFDEAEDCAARGVDALARYRGTDEAVMRRIIAARPAIACVERPDLLRPLL